MSTTDQILKITPTREQWNRFIIIHTKYFVNGSSFRAEEFARQLVTMEKELTETGSITLTNDNNMIEHWNSLVEYQFILDDDYPNFP